MAVEFGVTPILVPGVRDFDKILNQGIEILKSKGYLKENDTVILSGGLHDANKTDALATQATGTILKI